MEREEELEGDGGGELGRKHNVIHNQWQEEKSGLKSHSPIHGIFLLSPGRVGGLVLSPVKWTAAGRATEPTNVPPVCKTYCTRTEVMGSQWPMKPPGRPANHCYFLSSLPDACAVSTRGLSTHSCVCLCWIISFIHILCHVFTGCKASKLLTNLCVRSLRRLVLLKIWVKVLSGTDF